MDFDLSFYCLAIVAVLLTGISKSGFGGALGGMAVPLIALTIAVPKAAAIMLPILLVMDLIGLLVFRGAGDRTNLNIIIPGAILGIVIGALTFHLVSPELVKALIGIEAIIFGLDRLRTIKAISEGHPPDIPRGLFWSCISGFTSFISHAGGPPILQYLLPQAMDRKQRVGTTVIYFSFANFAKLIPYSTLGLLNWDNLVTSAILLPAVPIGYWIGTRLLKVLPQRPFNFVVAISLLLTGIRLAYDVLRANLT